MLGAANGHVFDHFYDGAAWQWLDHGLPTDAAGATSKAATSLAYVPTASSYFVVSLDGRLFERHWAGSGAPGSDLTQWTWIDHGSPPETSASTPPGAVIPGEQRLFVGSADGRLFERSFDGSRWSWHDHGSPLGTRVATAPSEALVPEARKFFLGSADGRLFERHWEGNAWLWTDHGRPWGTEVATTPGASIAKLSKLFMGTRDGRLFERWWDGSAWQWSDHGATPTNEPAVAYPSSVYPSWHSSSLPGRNHRLAARGATPNAATAWVIEVRGWLRAISDGAHLAELPNPPDFTYDIDLDPEWADHAGIDLNQIMRVGGILSAAEPDANGVIDHFRAVSPPRVKAEAMSWYDGADVSNPNWTFSFDDPDSSQFTWLWDPRYSAKGARLPLRDCIDEGCYVRIVGAIDTDDPHWGDPDIPGSPDYTRASKSWGNLMVYRLEAPFNAKEAASNPVRWTEIHPPDTIELVPHGSPRETVKCVAVFAHGGFWDAESKAIDIDIAPPGPRPDPWATIGHIELVGADTDNRTIYEGNSAGNGARITVYQDHINVYVLIKGWTGISMRDGKFKAIYRVFWNPGGLHLRVDVQPPSGSVMTGQPVRLTVEAFDWHTGDPIAGRVRVDSDATSYPTGSFDYTFHGASHRITVSAASYPDETARYEVEVKALNVSVEPYPVELGRQTITVSAADAQSGTLVDGKVIIDTKIAGATNRPFAHIFAVHPGIGPDGELTLVYPAGRVEAQDYADTPIDFGFPEPD